MMENMNRKVERLARKNARRRLWKRFVAIPAAVVVFVTTYALILPAIALEGETYCGMEAHQHTEECYTAQLACGYEDGAVVQDVETWMELACAAAPHQHTEECFDENGTAVCGYADYLIHEHNADCYNASGELICPLPEVKAHTHDENCYVTETVNVCGMSESAGHTHSEACYSLVSHPELVCGQEESAGHVHTEACYTTSERTYLACGLEESAGHMHDASCYNEAGELICTVPESIGHTHSEACYATEAVTELTCTVPESAGHAHSEACWANVETMELTCGQEESAGHTHTEACFAEQQRLVCPLPEVIAHTHTDECWTVTGVAEDGTEIKELTCGQIEVNEHVHTAGCFATYENIVEHPHQHTDLCYIQTLTCTLPEHAHVQECYVEPEEPADGEIAEPEASEEPAEPEYVCGKEEHTHDETCYDETRELVCQLEEHTHDEACLAEVVEIIDDGLIPAEPEASEEPEYVCGKEEHTHDETCYDETGALICQLPEHTHDETCLAEVVEIDDGVTPLLDRLVLICDKEEHVHGPECMNEALEYICGKEIHEHTADCYATVSDDGKIVYCGIAEHTHDASCYDANGLLICELPEHTHDELCYMPPEAAELKLAASRQVKTFKNDDVLVTVVYGPEANIPVQSELYVYQVTEQSEPERYAQRVAEMKAMLMPETLEDIPAEADLEVEELAEEPPILIYNIGFYVNGVEIEPAAPVTVTVHILNEDHMPTSESYAIVHFAEARPELLENTVDEAGAATFETKSFSDFGVAFRDAETGADSQPLPEPQADEPQDQGTEVPQDQTVDEPQDQNAEVPQDGQAAQDPEIADDPSTTTYAPQDSNENNDYGIMPVANNNTWIVFASRMGTNKGTNPSNYFGTNDLYYKWPSYNNDWTVTLPTEGRGTTMGDQSDYTVKGWRAAATGDYFTAGAQVKVGTTNYGSKTLSYGNVFYPDWWPENYNFATSGITDVPDTWSVAKTYLYDFNELINFQYADFSNNATVTGNSNNNTTTSGSYDNATWSAKNNAKKAFGFLSTAIYHSGDLGYFTNVDTTDDRIQTGLAGQITSLFNTQSSPGDGINVLGEARYLFQYDEDSGYYYYDSNRNAAAFNQSQKRFYLSENTDKIGGSSGQFLPFNKNGVTYSNNKSPINYWFGMKTEISFDLPDAVGGVNANLAENGSPLRFIFSGDDDVLVYVTNNDTKESALVLDIGGIHGEMYGEIDFSDGTWKTGNAGADSKGWPMYTSPDEGSTSGTLQALGQTLGLDSLGDAGSYTLTMYYLERGAGLSNCSIYFNLPNKKPEELPPSGGTNTGTGSVAGKKQIDYLGDGNINDYSLPTSEGDARDLYRLYLTASNNREANPINVLLIVDTSGSMSGTKMRNLQNYLGNNQDNLIDTVLPNGTKNKMAIVTFSGRQTDNQSVLNDASLVYGWGSSATDAKTAVNRFNANGGTNYTRGLQVAEEALNALEADRKDYQTFVVFLSDGNPTFSVRTYTNQGRTQYSRQGNGSDTVYDSSFYQNENARSTTIAEIEKFNALMATFPNHTVRAIAYDTQVTEFLNAIDGEGTPIIANNNSTSLTDAIEKALQLTPVSNVQIQDTLSEYVEFAGSTELDDAVTDVQVYLKDTANGDKTLIWDDGVSKANIPQGNDTASGKPYVEKVELSGKNIKVTFTPGYVLPNNYELEVSFNIRLTQKAYDTYATGGGYPNEGAANTDYKSNQTSSEQPGFFSNDSSGAVMEYYQDSKKHDVTYPDPVVQVWRPVLKVVKMDETGTKRLSGAEFKLYKVVDGQETEVTSSYSTDTGEDGSITIDGLASGTYTLRETKAPDGYQTEPKDVTFTVKNGLIVSMTVNGEAEENPHWALGDTENDFTTDKWSWTKDTNPNYPGSKWVFNYEISLKDQPADLKLQITKQELDSDNKVEGAVFTLWQDVKPEDADDAYKPEFDKKDDAELHKDLKTDENGILMDGERSYVELETGVYFLEETQAPDGYNKLEEPIVIYVTHDGNRFTVSYSGPYINENGTMEPVAEPVTSDYWQITIYNTYGYALPETGGVGTAVYTLSGLALMALAGALLCDRRRRAARG